MAIFVIWLSSWDVQHSITPDIKPPGKSPTQVVKESIIGLKDKGSTFLAGTVIQLQQVASVGVSTSSPDYIASPTDLPANSFESEVYLEEELNISE